MTTFLSDSFTVFYLDLDVIEDSTAGITSRSLEQSFFVVYIIGRADCRPIICSSSEI